MKLGKFSVSLAVKDIAASRAFYEKLGFRVTNDHQAENWLVLQNETTTIGLFQGMFDKNMMTFNPGWDHTNATPLEFDDVRDIQKTLKAHGLTPDPAADESTTGPAYLMLSDPDGNPILIDQHVLSPPNPKKKHSPYHEVNVMNYAETVLPEFDGEVANTRKVLERVPENKLDWQAHPMSHTIGWNANHLAEILGWVEGALTTPSWDFAPIGGELYQPPKLTSRQEILDLFDRNAALARKAIAAVNDGQITQPWSLLKGGTPLMTMPRATMIRKLVLNHLIHHRAILCVYLRQNDVSVPVMYGPEAEA